MDSQTVLQLIRQAAAAEGRTCQVAAVRKVTPRNRRASDGHVLPAPAGARLLLRGLPPLVLRTDERRPHERT